MALKLNKIQRWLPSKRYLLEQFGVSVHYSNIHHDYYSAWRYVTKSDEAYEESNGHPDLVNTDVPKTSKASIGKRNLRGKAVIKTQTKTKKKPKRVGKARKKRLTPLDVSNLILSKNIKTETELHALAQEQREQGKTDLVEFILNRSPKTLADILSTTWQMKGAREKIARSTKSRMDLLQEASNSDCVSGCNGDWLQCAKEVLQNNGIDISCFANSVRESLTIGRKKHHYVMIVGPANCGKTFLLKPLKVVYHTFCNLATGSFATAAARYPAMPKMFRNISASIVNKVRDKNKHIHLTVFYRFVIIK
ncbi:Hypothetical predicted protein [Paramuricea clavata]|uniref:Uncharacterized protein n=1 Tax=Paramuricea clavata TaxID=317549 RepID=A0A6S7GQV8_PARCT|nr:Hypothetical predicted protein [Paramuricea clavata]